MDSKLIQGGHVALLHNVYPECMQPVHIVQRALQTVSRTGQRKVTTNTLHATYDHDEGEEKAGPKRDTPQETEAFDDRASRRRQDNPSRQLTIQ